MKEQPIVTITVDNKEVQVPGNTNLIEALKAAGLETPHLCYHPDLPVSGNCRQCMVEVEGPRGMALTIGCYTPVRAGMKVATPASSPKVAEARKAVLEFLLVNHPLDCPICDKAGECLLQENYIVAGASGSRLSPEAGKQYHGNPEHSSTDSKGQHRGGKRVDIGPRVVLDEERCIQCSRCVRFMLHVAGDEQLQLASRGGHSHITTFPGEKLDHPYDRCVTDICPVGALTDKSFRFRKRVWTLSRVPTISMDDSLGANIWVDYADGIIYRIMPRCNPEVNKSWLSNAARDIVKKIHENRLLSGPSRSFANYKRDKEKNSHNSRRLMHGGRHCCFQRIRHSGGIFRRFFFACSKSRWHCTFRRPRCKQGVFGKSGHQHKFGRTSKAGKRVWASAHRCRRPVGRDP